MKIFKYFLVLIGLFVLTACDSDVNDNDTNGNGNDVESGNKYEFDISYTPNFYISSDINGNTNVELDELIAGGEYYLQINIKAISKSGDNRNLIIGANLTICGVSITQLVAIEQGDTVPSISIAEVGQGEFKNSITTISNMKKGWNPAQDTELNFKSSFKFRASEEVSQEAQLISLNVLEDNVRVPNKTVNKSYIINGRDQIILETPKLRIELGKLMWDPVENATGYIVSSEKYIHDYDSPTVTSVDLSLFYDETVTSITVRAKGSGDYLDSALAYQQNFSKVAKFESYTCENNILQWGDINNPELSKVYIGDSNEYEIISDNKFDITSLNLKGGENAIIKITKVGNENKLDSDALIVPVSKLSTTTVSIDANKLTWTPISNAKSYTIYVKCNNDIIIYHSSTPSYDLNFREYSGVKFIVTVVANGDGTVLDSDHSQEIEGNYI